MSAPQQAIVPDDPVERHLEMMIESSLRHMSLVTTALRGICEGLGFSEEGSLEIELCAVEAITNSIVHGYSKEPGHRVLLTIDTCRQELRLRIVDEGSAVPAEARHRPPGPTFDPNDLHSVPDRGRGLLLIHHLMDRVEIQRESGRNQILLVKELPPTS